ncbi:MAG: hypothetical protein QOH59_1813 [Gemmatimonadales bacterium]|nr:hypothetical protein [Gemmatimonadales bacterium]
MRELVLENAGGKWSPSQEASCIVLADKDLNRVGQPFPDRCEREKCKDRARLGDGRGSNVDGFSNQLKLPPYLPECG